MKVEQLLKGSRIYFHHELVVALVRHRYCLWMVKLDGELNGVVIHSFEFYRVSQLLDVVGFSTRGGDQLDFDKLLEVVALFA